MVTKDSKQTQHVFTHAESNHKPFFNSIVQPQLLNNNSKDKNEKDTADNATPGPFFKAAISTLQRKAVAREKEENISLSLKENSSEVESSSAKSNYGKKLPAHELPHVVQQTNAVQGWIQRKATIVPAPFMGSSPANDSAVEFNPFAALYIAGKKASFTDFPHGNNGSVNIKAGTKGIIRFNMDVKFFKDDILWNDDWTQTFLVDWNVSATRDGKLIIEGLGGGDLNAASDNNVAVVQSINAAQGSDFVMVNPIIGGRVKSGGLSTSAGPVDVEVGSSYPAQSIARSFRVNIVVTDIDREVQIEITVGAIKVPRSHAVFFAKNKAHVSSHELNNLLRWYKSLKPTTREQIISGAERIDVKGYASTSGEDDLNFTLSKNRAEAVSKILKDYEGINEVVTSTPARGESEAKTPNNVEDARERRAEVLVMDEA